MTQDEKMHPALPKGKRAEGTNFLINLRQKKEYQHR
jgi:hypothetical protein